MTRVESAQEAWTLSELQSDTRKKEQQEAAKGAVLRALECVTKRAAAGFKDAVFPSTYSHPINKMIMQLLVDRGFTCDIPLCGSNVICIRWRKLGDDIE